MKKIKENDKQGLINQTENSVIYGTKIEGVITKKLLSRIKKMIKADNIMCDMGSQNPPLCEILWECKSAEDAIKHGYTEHLWYRCKTVDKIIVSMNYLVNIDTVIELEQEGGKKLVPHINKTPEFTMDDILGSI